MRTDFVKAEHNEDQQVRVVREGQDIVGCDEEAD
jgi:hypothetical protein